MATKQSLMVTFSMISLIIIFSSSTLLARPLMKRTMDSPSPSPSTSLVYRLKLDGEETGYCWDSLMQLQHCSGELIMFFLNGETYIGSGCCNAIRTVGSKCWPTMIGVLGFTSQEGDMLQGYCDNDHEADYNNGDSVKFKPTIVVKSSNHS